MNHPQLANAGSERPPGPHNPDVQIVVDEDRPKSSPRGSDKSHGDGHDRQKNNATRQRVILTDPVAFR